MPGRQNHIASVLKAVALIDALAKSPGERTLTELAAETGQPVPTAHRLLATLEYAGWLTHDNRGYALSVRMAEIAGHVLSGIGVRSEALLPMQRLTAETGETSYLGIREGDTVLCVERIESLDMVRVMSWDVGKVLPLRVGGAALALLAYQTDEEARRIVAETPLNDTMPHAVSDDELLHKLPEIRKRGYALSSEEIIPGITSVGSPIFDQAGALTAAVSIGGLTPRIVDNLERVGAAVMAAAEQVSRNLGYSGAYPPP
ncbi:IclR family transcriptional regulator [Jatrophihabitans sp. DSM 45814]